MFQTVKNIVYKPLSHSQWFIDFALKRRERRRLSQAQFQALQLQFGKNKLGRARHFHDHFLCRAIIDPNFTRLVKKLKADFQLRNFVETGTYDGETSIAMSLLFDRVFTCDVIDWDRRPEFYFADNLLYETKSSPDFLRAHLAEMKEHSLFYLDAHWGEYWPLRDEMAIIFGSCQDPVIVIDDFDAGNGLFFDYYKDQKLDLNYIANSIPADYRFCLTPWSNRNRGMIFIFPGSASYGCPFAERDRYSEEKHGLWGRTPAA